MRKVLFLTAVLVFAVSACSNTGNVAGNGLNSSSKESSPGYTANVSGNWTVNMSGRRGAETLDLVIKVSGSELAISGTHSRLGDVAGSGTLNGNAIVMSVFATGERKLGYKLEGTVTGDKMAGTRQIDRSNMDRAGGGTGGGARGAGRNTGSISNEWTAERK